MFAAIFTEDVAAFQCFYTKSGVWIYDIVVTSKLHLTAIYLSNNLTSVSSVQALLNNTLTESTEN